MVFECGDSITEICWCNAYPKIFPVDLSTDCLCPKCLHNATKNKIEAYVLEIKQNGIDNNIAATLKKTNHYIQDLDYYIENGFWVFTEWHHLKRGTCCKSGCRHCPYGFKK